LLCLFVCCLFVCLYVFLFFCLFACLLGFECIYETYNMDTLLYEGDDSLEQSKYLELCIII